MRSLKITKSIQFQAGVRWHRVCGLLAIVVAASLFSVKLLLAVYAVGGDLDTTYGNSGSVTNTFSTSGVLDLALQADGKVLAVGPTNYMFCDYPGGADYANFKIARFTSNGDLDTSFHLYGSTYLDLGGLDEANSLAVQPDGKILVAGYTAGCSSPYVNGVVLRYTTNGYLDTAFGNDGKALHSSAIIYAMALQPDGKILVVGQKRFAGDYRCLIARLNPNGGPDYSFGTYGEIYPDVWPSVNDNGFRKVVLQNDGKIVVLSVEPSSPNRYRLLRYGATGQPDSSFGFNGVFTSDNNESGLGMLLQSDGRIVISGYFHDTQSGVSYGALYRHNSDGNLDPTFGNGGKVYAAASSVWSAAAKQDDGKLVVSGSTSGAAALWRYQANGSLDTGFGANGQVTSAFQPYGGFGSLVLQGDGRVLAGGAYGVPGSSVLARYLNDYGTPASADVRVSSATISPRTVHPGDFVTYTIPVTNYGPGKAAHLTFTAQTPAHTVFTTFSAPPGWVVYQQPSTGGTGDVSCSAYELPAGSTVNFTLTVRVSLSATSGTQINQVSSIKSFMPDPNIFNNTWTKSFTVQ